MMNKTKLFLTYYNKNSAERLIKNRAHIIEIMINCLIQFINTTDVDNQDNGLGHFEIISNDYYSRLFICQSNKIYSFNIPFKINIEEKNITALYSDLKIDSQILTVLKELITKNWFSEKSTYSDLYDDIEQFDEVFQTISQDYSEEYEKDLELEIKDKLVEVCRYLLSYEIGYLRYDNDIDGEKKHGKNIHPQHHIDVNYSRSSSYKLGLNKVFSTYDMNNLLDSKVNCYFLTEI